MNAQQPIQRGSWKLWLVVTLVGLLLAALNVARDGSLAKLYAWLILVIIGSVMTYRTRQNVWHALAEEDREGGAD